MSKANVQEASGARNKRRNGTTCKHQPVCRANAARGPTTLAEVLLYVQGRTNFLDIHPYATEQTGLMLRSKRYGCERVQELFHAHAWAPPIASALGAALWQLGRRGLGLQGVKNGLLEPGRLAS